MSKSQLVRARTRANQQQSGRCYYCTALMWSRTPHDYAARCDISINAVARFQCTAEHLLARKNGGHHLSGNIVAACKHCNQKRHARRSDLTPEQFKRFVAKRLSKQRWHEPWVFQRRGLLDL
jgi:5-methylcytosine-specific restriction endonuclease McrA